MNRLLLVVLLVLLPLQLVWAAAAPYCAHETRIAGTTHFGHHAHQHEGAESVAPVADASAKVLGTYHADCETCHLGTSSFFSVTPIDVPVVPQGVVHGDHGNTYRSHVPSGPERPDRSELTAAACFGGGVEFRPLPS